MVAGNYLTVMTFSQGWRVDRVSFCARTWGNLWIYCKYGCRYET